MSSLKQESRQSSLGNSMKEIVLENGSDSSPLSDGSGPLEVSSSGASSSDSSGDSSSDSRDSSDESSSDDSSDSSSGSSDKKAVCLLRRINDKDLASKKVYFTEDQCRWTMIKHPVSVNKVRNFVQTASNAFVDVLFEGKIMNVDITLGDDLEEKLRVSMKASSERNCVTVAEEYQTPLCCVKTEDLDNIGSYHPCSGTYPPNDCFGTTDYKLDFKKTRENDGAKEFVTKGGSLLNFSFGEKDGKETVNIYFAYGNKESKELAFDFEVRGHDLNVANLPLALVAPTTTTAPPLSSALTTTTTATASLLPPNNLQILHGWTVKSPGITVEGKAGEKESKPTTAPPLSSALSTTVPPLCSALSTAAPPLSSALTTTTTTTTTSATTAPQIPPNNLQILHGWTVDSPGITRTVKEKAAKEESTTTTTSTALVIADVMPMQKK